MNINRIQYLLKLREIFRNTTEAEWTIGTLHSDCGTKHCALGHLHKYNEKLRSLDVVSIASFLIPIYTVNDNTMPFVRSWYPYTSPRARVLAYIDDEIAIASGCARVINKFMDAGYYRQPITHIL